MSTVKSLSHEGSRLQPTVLTGLPLPLRVLLCSYMDNTSLKNVMSVCKSWKSDFSAQDLAEQLATDSKRYVPLLPKPNTRKDWWNTYFNGT